MKKLVLFAIITATLLAASCSTAPICATSSITPMEGKKVTENLGRTSGSDSAFSVFGLFMIGSPDMQKAIEKALKEKGGDTLINVRCYEVMRYYLLFSTTEFVIYGDAVKTADSEEKKGGGRR